MPARSFLVLRTPEIDLFFMAVPESAHRQRSSKKSPTGINRGNAVISQWEAKAIVGLAAVPWLLPHAGSIAERAVLGIALYPRCPGTATSGNGTQWAPISRC